MNNLQTLSEHLNEASSAFKHAVQQALQAAGYNLKQSDVKVGAKKVRGLGTKITLNGETIGFDDDIPKMIARFTKNIQEDPEKYGLKESVNEGGGYTKVQDELEELIQNMSKRAYDGFAGEYDIDPEDAAEMMGFITDIPDKDAKRVIKDIKKGLYESVNEGSSNYSLLDFFKEMQSFPAAGVDSEDIKDASSPKNKKKTVKNTPALKGLLDQWMSGSYDEDPGYLVDELRDLLEKDSVNFKNIQPLNEFGPMAGSNNRSWKTSDLVDRIGDLEDMLWNGNVRRAEKEWEMVSGQYLTGEEGAKYWGDLDDDDLRSAIDDAEQIMKKHRMKEPDQQGGYGRNESVNEADQMHGEYLMQMLKAQADDLKKQGEPKTAAAMMYLWDRINQSARDEDIDAEELHNYLNEPRGRKHSQNLPEWMILDLFVESFIMKEDNVNEGSILVWDEMEKPFEDLKSALDKVSRKNTDPKWSKALLSIWNQIEKAETNLNNYDRKLGAIETNESVNEAVSERMLKSIAHGLVQSAGKYATTKEQLTAILNTMKVASKKLIDEDEKERVVKYAMDEKGIKESVSEKKVPPNDETIKFHIDSYRVDDDPYDVAKEIGDYYNWTEREIEKAEKILRKKYLK